MINNRLIEKFKNINCILAYETAAEYLGLFVGFATGSPNDKIFTKNEVNIGSTKQYIIDDYNKKDYICINDKLLCTTEEQTIIDLIENDGDLQVILESMADYYFKHNESFELISVPDTLKDRFELYSKWAIEYYDD